MDFSALPKVELHLHLDCSLSFAAVSHIDPTVTMQTYQQDFNAPEKFADLADFFLRCNLNALSSAFLPEDVKGRLEKQVRAGY